jgi:hypothetical protein
VRASAKDVDRLLEAREGFLEAAGLVKCDREIVEGSAGVPRLAFW